MSYLLEYWLDLSAIGPSIEYGHKTMCSKSQNFSKIHFRFFFLKTVYFTKNEISSYESIFWSLAHSFLVFCLIQLKNSENKTF